MRKRKSKKLKDRSVIYTSKKILMSISVQDVAKADNEA